MATVFFKAKPAAVCLKCSGGLLLTAYVRLADSVLRASLAMCWFLFGGVNWPVFAATAPVYETDADELCKAQRPSFVRGGR